MADEQSATPAPPAAHDAPPPSADTIDVTLTHGGAPHTLTLPAAATLAELAAAVEVELAIPASNQKYLVPRLGLLKPPFTHPPDLRAAALAGKKVTLMGTTASGVAALAAASTAVAQREAARAQQRRRQPAAYTTPATTTHEATYTFLAVRPLAGLPRPERSRAFLERLRADPGVVAAMRRHRFTVGLLTEMDPLSYTEASHEGTTRILGLNRNKGEVIELRLRTDAYDGYRDYKTIRATLCHELAHNVHSDHDRAFWDLCRQIEREVARADWKGHGRSLDGGAATATGPPSLGDEPGEDIAYDHGGWTGGAFVLGGGAGRSSSPGAPSQQGSGASSSSNNNNNNSNNSSSHGGGGGASGGRGEPLTRREIMARAAEERMRKMTDEERQPPAGPGGRGSAS